MKTLYESLLDDEEDVLDDDTLIIDEFIKQINQEYKELFDNNKYKYWEGDIFTYDKTNKILNIDMPYTGKFNVSTFFKKIRNYLKCNAITFNNRYNEHNKSEVFFKGLEISNNMLAPIINFNNIHRINLSDCTVCKNIEFNINDKNWAAVFTPEWKGNYSNLTINMNCPQEKILNIGTDFGKNIPDLSWITSNADELIIYDCSLFDSGHSNAACDKLAEIIDLNEPVFIYDKKLNKYIEKKYTITKLIAAVNNVKRYIFSKEYQFKLTKNANITKTLGLQKLKNINSIKIKNNNAEFLLTKSPNGLKDMIAKHFDYSNPNKIKIPKTNDGWYVILYKRD